LLKVSRLAASFCERQERSQKLAAKLLWKNAVSDSPQARLPWWRRWFGTRSERAAAGFLKRLGYHILARNYSCALGELDLVALDHNCIVFVEVRSTEESDAGRPAESVDRAKQQRLTNLAKHFLKHHHLLGRPARFDVLAVSWPANQREPEVVHHSNAFEAVGRFQMDS
jgi:putative endonuclease